MVIKRHVMNEVFIKHINPSTFEFSPSWQFIFDLLSYRSYLQIGPVPS
jgi:hypothetical protein